jgi:Protein of unknown function C-terminus (DUF2399)/Protein of unknown function N-terminus (DUF3323)
VVSAAYSGLLGDPYGRLWVSARRALEGNGLQLTGSIVLANPSDEEKRALHALLGRGSSRVELSVLDRAINDAVGMGLIEWLVDTSGELRDRAAERAARVSRRFAVESVAIDHELAKRSWFEEWMKVARRDGAIANAVRFEERQYLQAALEVLEVVLSGGHDRVPLATAVAAATGDTKRLNSGTVRALVEHGLALEAEIPRPTRSAERRLLWALYGIVVDDVSSDVLVLNIRPVGDSALARWLREAADLGEPFRITLRQLERAELTFEAAFLGEIRGDEASDARGASHRVGSKGQLRGAGRALVPVSVCENPAIVMDAAIRLGGESLPLLCTEGVPSDAFWKLANAIAEGGSPVRVHADFDASGCTIVASVIDRLGATPWRFDAQNYERALVAFGDRVSLPRSKGTPPETPWDPKLGRAISRDTRSVFEELLVDELLADLVAFP